MTPTFKERLREIIDKFSSDRIDPYKSIRKAKEEAIDEILKLVKEAVPKKDDLGHREGVGFNRCRQQFLTNIGEDSDSQTNTQA